jgi:tRNA(Ile)-lysidine synthase
MLFSLILTKFEEALQNAMLFEKFKLFVKEQGLFDSTSKILLAVSGGIDSMVMMHLFSRMKMSCSVAHCNFQLRGNESDGDEEFVREQASNLYYKIFVTRFETEEYAAENHLSIQMAARELRYTWFEKLAKAHQFDYIAVAHNRDDAMETFFINLGRGSGIAGLTGIRSKSENIIRPMLCVSRSEIEQYVKEKEIPYREDSSNTSDKYLRNFIRHQIIPGFEEVFPHFRESMAQNIDKLNGAYLLYQDALNAMLTDIIRHKEGLLYIHIAHLTQTPAPKTILFEILRKYGFSSPTTDDIYKASHAAPGKQFTSATHKLIKDREYFIVAKLEPEIQPRFYIEEGTSTIHQPIALGFETIEINPEFTIDKNRTIALLDYDQLIFPLIIRKWQPGDYFIPLGMTGVKKLSDFFIDIKLSIIEKENTWLLISGNKVAWIIGKRVDDRFKITETTRKVLKVTTSI